jgi:hypothetical protein
MPLLAVIERTPGTPQGAVTKRVSVSHALNISLQSMADRTLLVTPPVADKERGTVTPPVAVTKKVTVADIPSISISSSSPSLQRYNSSSFILALIL